MKPAKGYYSLIQYCPDLSRLEAANIGVLLYCPDRWFLKALTARDNKRIIDFFGKKGHDWSQINSYKLGLEERLQVEQGGLKTLDDLKLFIAQRANRIQITPPRPMLVDDPERELEALFKELVGGAHRKQRGHSFRQFVNERLIGAGLERKLRKDFKVTVPVLDRQIDIPFGYQNGRFNLIQVARFRVADPVQAETTACRYAVQGRSLYEHPDPEFGQMQLVVVGEFPPRADESKATVRRILGEGQVELFTAKELDRLIETIRTTGKDLATSST